MQQTEIQIYVRKEETEWMISTLKSGGYTVLRADPDPSRPNTHQAISIGWGVQ